MAHRIESELNNVAAIVARSTTAEAAEANLPGITNVSAPESVSYPDFDALIEEIVNRRKSARAPRSPQEIVADFIEPRISDPAAFRGTRPLSILERLAAEVIPALEENEELRSLAGAVITEEIERHRELALRLQDSIAL
jgi:hypothetical protein